MKTSESTKNINRALFKFQGSMPKIKRNANNAHFKSKYMTWDDLADAVIPYMQQCGLYFEQEEGEVDGYVTVSTRINHVESGEYKQYAPYRIKEATSGNQDHNAGKSTTYAMKRSLILALGLRGTDEDTDGNDIDPPKKQNSYTRDSSAKYNASYNKKENTQEVSLDRKREHNRMFGICANLGISDKKRRAITYLLTGKITSKELSIEEYKVVNERLSKSNTSDINYMVNKAVMMKKGAV